ncbi:sulfatase [Pseudoclavibacter endophyticus]|uniref:Sulfatase n=1 Tax=Pseudoclavibacter endophyticus TaxID=1778590 RepID=A0A6H9WW28_9MICO|nr:sulfatase [Pseudoclavibacter endophyticus]KAB1650370.1 sulfatase [Pseudoclavibacter endophyticus]
MRAIILMFDSLNRHMLPPYGGAEIETPNFTRLAERSVTFENFSIGSMPCMPARREMHTGRYNFLHRSWGPLEPFDDSMPELLSRRGIHTHLVSDHPHYWEDGGATYHTRYTTWEGFRGQEGDAWKAVVGSRASFAAQPGPVVRAQDRVNRTYMDSEATHVQTRTVDAGIDFLDTNAEADEWLLQLELFDPHEPFFAPQSYRDLHGLPPTEDRFDWPTYGRVVEDEDQVDEARREYASLVSFCDHSLGRVLDAMDRHDLWRDTLLIVNTDHGFLLGERGWWAKSVQPWFNELAHLPFFLWDPRHGMAGQRSDAIAQTIDLAPTLLGFFGLDIPEDMQGTDLGSVIAAERDPRDSALWGIHGGHVNIGDGRFVYMRAPESRENAPLEEFTLMPTHMRQRFSVSELAAWEPAPPFSFTKGLRTMRTNSTSAWMNAWAHGTLLFDLQDDPKQESPLIDDAVERRMVELLIQAMHANDAPASQFERLGLPVDGEILDAHLRCRVDAERAASAAEPLPALSALRHADELSRPLPEIVGNAALRDVLETEAPDLLHTEVLTAPRGASIIDLARRAHIPAAVVRRIDAALDDALDDALDENLNGAPR